LYARFGQELYARETARVAEWIADANGTGSPAACVAARLPYPSAATRDRLAAKFIQRLTAGCAGETGPETFARLLSGVGDPEAQRELAYYGAARADRLVGAVAREVVYPYFIDGALPRGVTENDVAAHNTGRLLTVEPVLTLPFVAWYAQTQWDFQSERTVALALRILRQAGLLLSTWLPGEARRTLAYTLAPHGLTLPAFVWGLYEEFAAFPIAPTLDRVERAAFVRTFVVPPAVIVARLRDAERTGFIRFTTAAGARRIILPLAREELIAGLME
jgi:hypothetical protein